MLRCNTVTRHEIQTVPINIHDSLKATLPFRCSLRNESPDRNARRFPKAPACFRRGPLEHRRADDRLAGMPIKAVLLDLEGVLYEGETPVDGAVAAVVRLSDMGLGLRYLTNTTTRARAGVAERLAVLGLHIEPEALFTPLAAARRLLQTWGAKRIRLAAPPEAAPDFAGLELAEAGPVDAVVLGDLYKKFDWLQLNELFGLLQGGARLVALHKNRYCRRSGAIGLDVGPFVAALEYAANTQAVVVGKPSAEFFRLALDDLGVEPQEAVMVGDDIDADIGGAKAAGLKAIQVKTGKFAAADLERADIQPDALIDTVADLPARLATLG